MGEEPDNETVHGLEWNIVLELIRGVAVRPVG